ncbi:MAG: phage holin family protein [Thermus sp.]
MRKLFANSLPNALALWLLSVIHPGVHFAPGSGLLDYLVVGGMLGVGNTFFLGVAIASIRPLLLSLSPPPNPGTLVVILWLLTVVVNTFGLQAVAAITALEVHGFLAALVGALILSPVTILLFDRPFRNYHD